MAESAPDPDVERRIGEHLEAIDRALVDKGVPRTERRSVSGDVEAQIRDMLAANTAGSPTPADVEAIFRKLDPPESYAEYAEAASSEKDPPLTPAGSPGSARAAAPLIMIGLAMFASAVVAGWWFLRTYFRIGPEFLEPFVLLLGWLAVLFLSVAALVPLVRGISLLWRRHAGSQKDIHEVAGFILFLAGLVLLAVGLHEGASNGPYLAVGLLTMWIGGLLFVIAVKPTAVRSYLAASGVIALLVGLCCLAMWR